MYRLGLLTMDGKTVRNIQSDIQQTRKIVRLVGFTTDILARLLCYCLYCSGLLCYLWVISS